MHDHGLGIDQSTPTAAMDPLEQPDDADVQRLI
jgi:hypothetical protein